MAPDSGKIMIVAERSDGAPKPKVEEVDDYGEDDDVGESDSIFSEKFSKSVVVSEKSEKAAVPVDVKGKGKKGRGAKTSSTTTTTTTPVSNNNNEAPEASDLAKRDELLTTFSVSESGAVEIVFSFDVCCFYFIFIIIKYLSFRPFLLYFLCFLIFISLSFLLLLLSIQSTKVLTSFVKSHFSMI